MNRKKMNPPRLGTLGTAIVISIAALSGLTSAATANHLPIPTAGWCDPANVFAFELVGCTVDYATHGPVDCIDNHDVLDWSARVVFDCVT